MKFLKVGTIARNSKLCSLFELSSSTLSALKVFGGWSGWIPSKYRVSSDSISEPELSLTIICHLASSFWLWLAAYLLNYCITPRKWIPLLDSLDLWKIKHEQKIQLVILICTLFILCILVFWRIFGVKLLCQEMSGLGLIIIEPSWCMEELSGSKNDIMYTNRFVF